MIQIGSQGLTTGKTVPWVMWYRRPSMAVVADYHLVNLRGGPQTVCGHDFEQAGEAARGLENDPVKGITLCLECVSVTVRQGMGQSGLGVVELAPTTL